MDVPSIINPMSWPLIWGAGITMMYQPWLVIPVTQAIVEHQIEQFQRIAGIKQP